MNQSISIKEYYSEYLDQVVELILDIQQNEYNIPITKEDQPDLFNIEQYYQSGNGNFWVALFENHVVGTISLLDIENNQVALRKMFVKKEFRGKEYKTAKLLLDNAISWSQRQSINEIYLGTTPQFLAAHRFYEKNGFKEVKMDELPEKFPILAVDKKFYKYIVAKKKTAILLYPLFSEYELSVAQSVLMQANKPIITVGINHHPVKGEAGLTCLPDTTVDEIDIEQIDSLLLTGCLDISTLVHEEKWFDFLRRAAGDDTIIASISSSPFLLAKAGLLFGKKYTVGLTEEAIDNLGVFEKENYSADLIVRDGNLLTARGSGFIAFGVTFGKMLNLDFNPKWYGKNE